MNNTDTNMRVARVYDEAAAIVRDKNPRYGSSWRDQGWRGNLSRILEKSGRLRSMLWKPNPDLLSASKEHPRETMLDMMNTLAFAIINMDDGLEYGHEQVYSDDGLTPAPPHPNPMQDDGTGFYSRGAQAWPGDDSNAYRPNANEVTATNLPMPGEEQLKSDEVEHVNTSPSPQPRAKVQDRGSGPRKRPIKDSPQA